jgi:hypothetical protein
MAKKINAFFIVSIVWILIALASAVILGSVMLVDHYAYRREFFLVRIKDGSKTLSDFVPGITSSDVEEITRAVAGEVACTPANSTDLDTRFFAKGGHVVGYGLVANDHGAAYGKSGADSASVDFAQNQSVSKITDLGKAVGVWCFGLKPEKDKTFLIQAKDSHTPCVMVCDYFNSFVVSPVYHEKNYKKSALAADKPKLA